MKTRILVPLVALAVGAVVLSYLAITYPRRNLDHVLEQVRKAEVGKSKLADWRTGLEHSPAGAGNLVCEGQICGVGWRIENKFLQKLHLAPRTTATVSLEFKGGIADDFYIWIEVDNLSDVNGQRFPGAGATVHQSNDPRTCSPNYRSYLKENSGKRWAVAAMGPCVSPDNRAKAMAIDSGCLSKVGGCEDGAEILPKVFGSEQR
jgi:hypothetical protein